MEKKCIWGATIVPLGFALLLHPIVYTTEKSDPGISEAKERAAYVVPLGLDLSLLLNGLTQPKRQLYVIEGNEQGKLTIYKILRKSDKSSYPFIKNSELESSIQKIARFKMGENARIKICRDPSETALLIGEALQISIERRRLANNPAQLKKFETRAQKIPLASLFRLAVTYATPKIEPDPISFIYAQTRSGLIISRTRTTLRTVYHALYEKISDLTVGSRWDAMAAAVKKHKLELNIVFGPPVQSKIPLYNLREFKEMLTKFERWQFKKSQWVADMESSQSSSSSSSSTTSSSSSTTTVSSVALSLTSLSLNE